MHDNFSGIRRGTIKLCKQKWAIYSRLALWPAISLVPPLQDHHLHPVHPVGGVAGQKRAQGSAQFVFICGFYENWVCLLLLCEMYKYLWSKKEGGGEIERERQRQMAEETTLSTLWKKNHTQICGSNCFACFVKHTSTCQMHNQQLKWKLTHELVALAKLPHPFPLGASTTSTPLGKLCSNWVPDRAWQCQQRQLEEQRKQQQKQGAGAGAATAVTVAARHFRTHKSEPKVQTKIIAMLCRLFAQPNRQLDFSHFHSSSFSTPPPPVAGEFACR